MNTHREFQREGLSIFEACQISGLGRTKLYSAIASGELVARKFGKRRIVLRDDLRQFLASLPIDTPSSKTGVGNV
ncbi:helix-turn-helix domain-containing protein [Leptospira interrogans]